MTLEEFNKVYNPKTQCIATYRDDAGNKTTGLLLGPARPSVEKGPPCIVHIDSLFNWYYLEEIISVKDTGKPRFSDGN